MSESYKLELGDSVVTLGNEIFIVSRSVNIPNEYTSHSFPDRFGTLDSYASFCTGSRRGCSLTWGEAESRKEN